MGSVLTVSNGQQMMYGNLARQLLPARRRQRGFLHAYPSQQR